ncbi:MAG: efflux RND transporter periplasmic adaptor subunit [Roseiarcus sp.]|uniref:efflux RND transporter periplasmic adaptor subunit n=2 Tax=Roseiarcus sp. TaxID=1969460 RepID=UPI003BB17661
MSGVEQKANDAKTVPGIKRGSVLSSLRVLPVLATVAAVALAAVLGYQAWQYYMGSPWTRDGTVRAYVVKVAPQVAGEIVRLPIADNQFVHKGDLLMLIDPRNYSIAVRQAQAAVEQARAVAENANAEMTRRLKLNDLAVTMEERQTYVSQAANAEASYQSALANLDQARLNFQRTHVRSPVNGYVTNLSAQLGNYADVGALQLSIVNSDSFWVDAYFEETALGRIHEGDAATIKLMGYSPLLRGRVQGLARGINVPNAQADASGLASVNPIFTFVRLAQRVPVRIHIDEVPEGAQLVAGLTATVQIEPHTAPSVPGPAPASQPVTKAEPEPAPSQVAGHAASQPAPVTMAPAQTPARAPDEAAEPQTAAQAQQNVAPPAAADEGANGLAVSAPPSAQASAAAAAASADLKTLEQQIASNPPSGIASPPTATNRPGDSSADMMPPSEYLGQTIDLFGSGGAAPEPRRRSPESIRRRARSRRHYGEP